MAIYFTLNETRAHNFYRESGISFEFGMCQVHGAIQATRYTRKIEFGCGWFDKYRDSWKAEFVRRVWITGHRAKHEPEPEKIAWHFYWRQHDGFRHCKRYI